MTVLCGDRRISELACCKMQKKADRFEECGNVIYTLVSGVWKLTMDESGETIYQRLMCINPHPKVSPQPDELVETVPCDFQSHFLLTGLLENEIAIKTWTRD